MKRFWKRLLNWIHIKALDIWRKKLNAMVQVSAKKKKKNTSELWNLQRWNFLSPGILSWTHRHLQQFFFTWIMIVHFWMWRKVDFVYQEKKDKDKVIIKSEISLVGSIEEEGSTALSNTRRGWCGFNRK